MGRLIINGNQVYEIDEECLKYARPPKDCDVWKTLKEQDDAEQQMQQSRKNKRDR